MIIKEALLLEVDNKQFNKIMHSSNKANRNNAECNIIINNNNNRVLNNKSIK